MLIQNKTAGKMDSTIQSWPSWIFLGDVLNLLKLIESRFKFEDTQGILQVLKLACDANCNISF